VTSRAQTSSTTTSTKNVGAAAKALAPGSPSFIGLVTAFLLLILVAAMVVMRKKNDPSLVAVDGFNRCSMCNAKTQFCICHTAASVRVARSKAVTLRKKNVTAMVARNHRDTVDGFGTVVAGPLSGTARWRDTHQDEMVEGFAGIEGLLPDFEEVPLGENVAVYGSDEALYDAGDNGYLDVSDGTMLDLDALPVNESTASRRGVMQNRMYQTGVKAPLDDDMYAGIDLDDAYAGLYELFSQNSTDDGTCAAPTTLVLDDLHTMDVVTEKSTGFAGFEAAIQGLADVHSGSSSAPSYYAEDSTVSSSDNITAFDDYAEIENIFDRTVDAEYILPRSGMHQTKIINSTANPSVNISTKYAAKDTRGKDHGSEGQIPKGLRIGVPKVRAEQCTAIVAVERVPNPLYTSGSNILSTQFDLVSSDDINTYSTYAEIECDRAAYNALIAPTAGMYDSDLSDDGEEKIEGFSSAMEIEQGSSLAVDVQKPMFQTQKSNSSALELAQTRGESSGILL
jgi:hypothetical protein